MIDPQPSNLAAFTVK